MSVMPRDFQPAAIDGLYPSTKIATAYGWRSAASISPGDDIHTLYSGLQTVTAVTPVFYTMDELDRQPNAWPIFIPPHAIGNDERVIVMPDQMLLVGTDRMLPGPDTCADHLFRACDLKNYNAISRIVPTSDVTGVALHFESDQIIHCGFGGKAFCAAAPFRSLDAMPRGYQSTSSSIRVAA